MATNLRKNISTKVKKLKIFIVSQWMISIVFFLFGLLWAFYGYLEYIGFGDGGTLPSQDLITIIVGLLFVSLGLIGIYNSKTGFKKKFAGLIYISFMLMFAIAATVTGCLAIVKNIHVAIYWVIIICVVWYFQMTSFFLYRNERGAH